MNNLIENYEIILNNLKLTCGDINSFTQIRTPKLNNLELVSLNLTAEYISINTEVQLFRCLLIVRIISLCKIFKQYTVRAYA